MKQLIAVIKNELIRYFISPLAYVYLVAFLFLNGSFAIYFGHFFDRGIADLSPMLSFQPWLYLLFITGISMRLWAEEFRGKTIVRMMTLPISTSTLVWGKFFASWIFCAIALLLTFPFIITVNLLGDVDNGVVLLGYFGSFMIAGCMLSISQTMSALTKNQVIALVLAFACNLMFFLSGLEYILAFFRMILPSYAVDMIASFSFLTHFDTIVSGLLEARDIVFFASIILLFNFCTTLIIDFKTSGSSLFFKNGTKLGYSVLFALFLAGFFGINMLSNTLLRKFQYDFTQEKIYTLNKNTIDILRHIENPVTIKLYYSPILGKNNPEIRKMFDHIKVLLSRFKTLADGKLEYKIYTPYPFDRVEDLAIGEGIEPRPSASSNQNALFGMSFVDSLDNKRIIPFLAVERSEFLEYDLVENILLLAHKKQTLGLLSSLPLNGYADENGIAFDRWEIINQIAKFYNIKEIKTADDIKDIDILMIVDPKKMNKDINDKIKQYAHAGGKAMIMLDSATEAMRLISARNSKLEGSDFSDLQYFFGFEFFPQYVVADFGNSILVDASSDYRNSANFTNDVIQFILKENDMNPKAQETKNLKEIMLSSASVIVPATDDINFVPLLRASKNSAVMLSDVVLNNTNPADILRFYQPDTNSKIMAARIFGKDASKPFDIIVVTDTDFLYDTFWSKTYQLPHSKYIVPILDNANFVLNSLETLSGKEYLSSLRGKSSKHRRFDKIEQMRRQNKLDYTKQELKILEEIDAVKQKLQEIWARKDFENRETFTADDLITIKNIRNELDAARQKLGNINKSSNVEIERIDMMIKFFNIYGIALIIVLGWLLLRLINRKKSVSDKDFSFIKNKKFELAAVAALILLASGIVVSRNAEKSSIDAFENKPVFADLEKDINNVSSIVLQDKDNKVELDIGKDGIWKNLEHQDFVVSQEQVRSFLSAMLEARYYEKKSDRAENLYNFGLLPLEDKNSTAVKISLKDKDGKKLVEFLLGKFDIDMGRGAKAAYIRFDQSFQVWLINADFIDASTDWRQWTLNTLWDLKFSRLKSFDGKQNQENLANLVKVLINTKLEDSTNKLDNPKNLADMLIEDEYGNKIVLKFYQVGEDYFVSRNFLSEPRDFYAKEAEKSSNGVYYKINKINWELIDYVRTNNK